MTEQNQEYNKRFVFRLSLLTLRKLKEHCAEHEIPSKSLVIRRAISSFNESQVPVEVAKTWKLLCPRGSEMVSVWVEKEMVAAAKLRASDNKMSLNQYVERALKSTLSVS